MRLVEDTFKNNARIYRPSVGLPSAFHLVQNPDKQNPDKQITLNPSSSLPNRSGKRLCFPDFLMAEITLFPEHVSPSGFRARQAFA